MGNRGVTTNEPRHKSNEKNGWRWSERSITKRRRRRPPPPRTVRRRRSSSRSPISFPLPIHCTQFSLAYASAVKMVVGASYGAVSLKNPSGDEDRSIGGGTKSLVKSFIMARKSWIVAALGILLVAGIFLLHQEETNLDSAASAWHTGSRDSKIRKTSLPMPDGVNIGSWLSLEDYFFAGKSAVEVATPDDGTAAVCLPPLHTGVSTGPTWHAETDLLENLAADTSLGHALRVFNAHRNSFLDFEEDLEVLSQLGIHSIRVPLSWCLTNEDPGTIDPKDDDVALLEDRFTCRDPFFDGVLWPAIPRSLLVRLLRACARHGIKATLDMHTYPGATSPGTFSGAWPRWPRFWTHGDQAATNEGKPDVGRTLWKDFVKWIESLDKETLQGLEALSPMNEPAHLAGIFGEGRGKDPPYLPPLPSDMAMEYLEKLATAKAKVRRGLTQVPDGPHLRVFKWLDDAISTFRESTLPSRGIRLAVNVHESVLNPSVLPGDDGNDPGGRHPGSMKILAAWWRGATLPKERSDWAVLDIHHYHAWEPQCQGASDGLILANYTCAIAEERRDTLQRCASWATVLRQTVDEECGAGAQVMSGEMSASTHHRVRHACNDITTLRESFLSQVQAAKAANIKLYWWSFKMPYGGSFRPAWSLKHFLWLMGVVHRPDESNYPCGDHVSIAGEPNDDALERYFSHLRQFSFH